MLNSQSERDVEVAAVMLFHELMEVVEEQLDVMDDLVSRIECARNRTTPTCEPRRLS